MAPALVIPDALRAKHPEIIDMIIGSQSMNDGERQYWINIMPVMTPEQLQSLRGILENEKRQLAAIDAKYAKAIAQSGGKTIEQMAAEKQQQSSVRNAAEEEARKQEASATESILSEIHSHDGPTAA